jgi:hypothetical protein
MLKLIIRCEECGLEVDTWDMEDDVEDHAVLLCEIAGDLNFEHECKDGAPESDEDR